MSKPQNTPPILPLKDFERIFRVIHGVLLNEECNPSKSCLYFGTIGAAILRMHYKLPAIPIVGVAAFSLDNLEQILVFADQENTENTLTNSAFHCWIQIDDWFLDFSSPLFPEMLASAGIKQKCGRKMFQKRLIESSGSIAELQTAGQFYCCPNIAQTHQFIKDFLAVPFNTDLQRICTDWYVSPPKKIVKTIGIADPKSITKPASLSPFRINGIW